MERLKRAKEALLCCVESQLSNLDNVDAAELGEVVDMVKDFEEAMYYCAKIKKMEEEEKTNKEEKEKEELFKRLEKEHLNEMRYGRMFYEDRIKELERQRDKSEEELEEYRRGRMEHDGKDGISKNPRVGGSGKDYPMEIRDVREGRSPMSRKNYMESKEMHHSQSEQMKELEKYMQELAQDMTELIQDATPEEKAMIQQKLSTLVTKIK